MHLATLFNICLACLSLALPQQHEADRIIALVNDEPILLSELMVVLPDVLDAEGDPKESVVRALNGLVTRSLIRQEVAKLEIFSISERDYRREYNRLMSDPAFRRKLPLLQAMSVDTTLDGMQSFIYPRLIADKFVADYIESFITVSRYEVRRFYLGEWLSQLRAASPDAEPPAFDDVYDELTELLRARKVNDRIEKWLNTSFSEARIVIIIDLENSAEIESLVGFVSSHLDPQELH